MSKKNLWLYKITKIKLFYGDKDREVWNFCVCRSLRGYKKNSTLSSDCRKLRKEGVKIKMIPKQEIELVDPWCNEKSAVAFSERRNWKRNSKRRHQWKEIINE